jgi:hypothetical protein
MVSVQSLLKHELCPLMDGIISTEMSPRVFQRCGFQQAGEGPQLRLPRVGRVAGAGRVLFDHPSLFASTGVGIRCRLQ